MCFNGENKAVAPDSQQIIDIIAINMDGWQAPVLQDLMTTSHSQKGAGHQQLSAILTKSMSRSILLCRQNINSPSQAWQCRGKPSRSLIVGELLTLGASVINGAKSDGVNDKRSECHLIFFNAGFNLPCMSTK